MRKNNRINSELLGVTSNAISTRSTNKACNIFTYIPNIFRSQKPVVAVLNLNGVIGKVSTMKSGLSLQAMEDQITQAFKLPKLSAVCLAINSPGGSPVQSELIADRIISLAKQKDIPVYSFVEDVAASGGYWLACSGSEIYASKSSILGSIGVISSSFGFHEAIAKLGIERRVYTEGKNKSILDPFQPTKPTDIKILKQIQHQIHQHFIDFVKSRRGSRLTQNDDILFNGEFWTGESALDFGLIDGIDNMYNFIQEKFGNDVKIEHIKVKQSWLKQKLSISSPDSDIVSDMLESIKNKIATTKYEIH